MASRARRDIQRNLLLVLLALVALGALIAAVGLMQGGEAFVLLPQEREKFLERRTNTADNGFAQLTEACNTLKALGPVPLCEDLFVQNRAARLSAANSQSLLDTPAAIGRMLGQEYFCPENDPRLKDYMAKSEAILAPVKAALEKPYLFYTFSSITPGSENSGELEGVRQLLRQLCALALYKSAVTADTAAAVGILQQAIAVCQGLEDAGSYALTVDEHHGPPDREGFFQVGLGLGAGHPWLAVPPVAKHAVDRKEPIDALLEMTRPALEDAPDRSAVLTTYCMMLDDLMSGEAAPAGLRFDKRMMMALTNRVARRDARIVLEKEQAIREAVNGPLREYPSRIRTVAGEGGMFGPRFMPLQMALMNVTPAVEGRRIVAAVAVRLEAFRRDHGDYPEKLEELVPQYLPKLPEHPIQGRPLAYTRFKEGYTLSEGGSSDIPNIRRMRFHRSIAIDMRVFPLVEPTPPPATPPAPPPSSPALPLTRDGLLLNRRAR